MRVDTLPLRRDPTGPATARRCVAADLAAAGVVQDDIDDVLLVVSELVSNAVLHARGEFEALDVGWEIRQHEVLVRVDDGSEAHPVVREVDQRTAGGRGLAIVAAIASDWGARATGVGKQVWAVVPVRRTG